MDSIKTAVIGIGNMGSAHAACIADGKIKGMTLSAVCDIDETRLNGFLMQHPGIVGYRDYDQLFKDEKPDAVIIATPHPLHSQIAIAALKNGIHVLLEKPADITISRVEELNRAATESGKIFSIMFNQRTNPLFVKARQIVKGGEIGDLKRVTWTITNWYRSQSYYESSAWRATWKGEGGGVLLNQAPHNLDVLQWICGMPQSVTAFCDVGKYHRIDVEDEASLFLRYQNGATGVFITSTGEYPGTNRLEIAGTLGKLVMEDATLKWWKLKEDEREARLHSPEYSPHIEYDYREFKDDAVFSGHEVILQNFANAVLHGEALIAPGTDGIHELTLSNAAYFSQWKGNAEIALPFDTAEFDKLLFSRSNEEKSVSPQAKSDLKPEYQARWNVVW